MSGISEVVVVGTFSMLERVRRKLLYGVSMSGPLTNSI